MTDSGTSHFNFELVCDLNSDRFVIQSDNFTIKATNCNNFGTFF